MGNGQMRILALAVAEPGLQFLLDGIQHQRPGLLHGPGLGKGIQLLTQDDEHRLDL